MRAGAMAGLLALAFACGPSLTSVHEGSVRFEHCNRLDLDDRYDQKSAERCWNRWLAAYTYGQPRDRIEYARRRVGELANGGKRPTLDVAGEPSEGRQFYLVVPSPTSHHNPPPPIATVWQDRDAGAAKPPSDKPPADGCADKCRTGWRDCTASCPDAGSSQQCDRCKEVYSGCMRSCFE